MIDPNTGFLFTTPELKSGAKGPYEAFKGQSCQNCSHCGQDTNYSIFGVVQGEGLNREYSLRFSSID